MQLAEMTQSARVRADEQTQQQKLDEQVKLWLKLNIDTLVKSKPSVTAPYESEFMLLDAE